ncbi:hypothetical protein C1H46_024364 [Malus baccata]|uniref:Uncharacterized protein n=1 Tax=Malus baccata TaxID=106549 RepID=A0A540LUP4_MALBA|nr:hypothetical protein C1H46_024364 [Malus baccata]
MEDAMPKLTPAERKLGLGPCEVCGKEKDHTTDECPYLEIIPKGEEGNVCEMYAVVCKGCGLEGGHPGKSWTGCAVLKYCSRCFVVGDHLYANCPNLEPEKRERLRQIKVKHHRLGINF